MLAEGKDTLRVSVSKGVVRRGVMDDVSRPSCRDERHSKLCQYNHSVFPTVAQAVLVATVHDCYLMWCSIVRGRGEKMWIRATSVNWRITKNRTSASTRCLFLALLGLGVSWRGARNL